MLCGLYDHCVVYMITVTLITVTLELSCALGYDPSATRTRGSARFHGTEMPVFEQP